MDALQKTEGKKLLSFSLPSLLGSEELYAKKLRAKCTGLVPMFSALYSSTETSAIGVNLWPKDEPAYLPIMSAAFFEFIPVDDCHEEQPKVGNRCKSVLQSNPFMRLLH